MVEINAPNKSIYMFELLQFARQTEGEREKNENLLRYKRNIMKCGSVGKKNENCTGLKLIL